LQTRIIAVLKEGSNTAIFGETNTTFLPIVRFTPVYGVVGRQINLKLMLFSFIRNKKELYRKKLMESEYWNLEPLGKAGWDKSTGDFFVLSKDSSHKWFATLDDRYADK
jgi:hypothetical protein